MNGPIVDRMKKLEEYLRLLEGIRGRDFEDPYMRGALERYFHLAAECVLDIGEMLIAREGWSKPETYRSVIQTMGEEGVIDPDFAEGFEGIAGLRNILVHDYTKVDLARLEALLDQLDDLRRFLTDVARYLDESGSSDT